MHEYIMPDLCQLSVLESQMRAPHSIIAVCICDDSPWMMLAMAYCMHQCDSQPESLFESVSALVADRYQAR